MNNLNQIGALGFDWPSPAYLSGALLFGSIGYAVFRRGRKASAPALTWSGVALMLYPYLVSQTWLLWLLGAALCGWVYSCWE